MKRFRISVLFLCLALAALPQGCEKGQVFELSCVVVEYIVNPKFQVLPQDQGASKGNSVEMPLASHHPPAMPPVWARIRYSISCNALCYFPECHGCCG